MKAILTYHSIDSSGSAISIDEQAFAAHVDWLASGAVKVLPLNRIVDAPDDEDAVAITFDDGFRNFADVAWPLLHAHDLPVTLFVVPGYVGDANRWREADAVPVPELSLATWDMLGRLADEGVTLGSHTRTHPNLKLIGAAQLKDEIRKAAEAISAHTGKWPMSFAYPYGAYDDSVVSAVSICHSLACTTDLRTIDERTDRLRLPRLEAYYFRARGTLESYGTARFRQYLYLRRAARSARSALLQRGANA